MKNLIIISVLALIFVGCAHNCHSDKYSSQDSISNTQSATSNNTITADMLTDSVTVKKVQRALTAAGHNSGPIDGIVGPITTGALKSYQNAKKLDISGNIDVATVNSLKITKTELKKVNL
ncbi:MAG: peptidoglycan-binding protein [Bacteriovoracaceae bacterium]|jgi:peptidoglycan hydrolase-like protein with peptidoglycan-binding domain|nr:peptidoglycan-binding protein [Bacteriovoracaceae bacterium]